MTVPPIAGQRPDALRGNPAGVVAGRRAGRWRRAGLWATLVLALVIALLTLLPLSAPVPQSDGLDKLWHFLAFAALVLPAILTDPRRWIWAVPLAIAYGGAIEVIQPSVGRGAEWLDWGADISGVLAGAALAEALHPRLWRRLSDDPAQANPPPADDGPTADAMRADLLDELRGVLREELATLNPPSASPAEGARGAPRQP